MCAASRVRTVVLACLLWGLAIALQAGSGAYRTEFGGHPDEAAHYVTGLMVRDYFAAGLPSPAMRFAENYYLHYPKVAIGHWPPFLYLLEGVWMLAFSPSRVSILLLFSLVTAALGALIYRVAREDCGEWAAAGAAVIFVSLPLVQEYTSMVMSEMVVALLAFSSALCWGRFLDAPRWIHAGGFTAFASLAIMTNGKGMALALLPVFSVLIGRRFDLLRRAAFWFPAPAVALLCGPWYLYITSTVMRIAPAKAEIARRSAGLGLLFLRDILGWTAAAAIAAGVVAFIVLPAWRGGRIPGAWLSLAALAAGVGVFQVVVNVGMDPRYLMTLLPALAVFLAGGMSRITDLVRTFFPWRAWTTPAVVLALSAACSLETFHVPAKPSRGYAGLVAELKAMPEIANPVHLIGANATREGAFIAEMAMGERRPRSVILRGSRVLAESIWSGALYHPRFEDSEALCSYLDSIPVATVAQETSDSGMEQTHRVQLAECLRRHPDRWRLVPLRAYETCTLRVYRRSGAEDVRPVKIELDMTRKLRRVLTLR